MTEPIAPAARQGRASRDGELSIRAYREIREAIVNLSFQPGQQLQESFLASWLGTSRTPVREALKRLQSEGLIESLSSRGVTVAQVSVEDVENAYFAIEALEGVSSRLAAERITEIGSAALRSLLDQMQEAAAANDDEGWVKVDGQFHDCIRGLAANPKITQVASILYPTIERVRNIYLREGSESDRLAAATANHCALGEAILAGDAARAEHLTRQLFATARQDNVRLLRHWVAPLRRSF